MQKIGIVIICLVLLAASSGCTGQTVTNATDNSEDPLVPDNAGDTDDQDAPLLLKIATTKIPESDAYQGLVMLKEEIEEVSDNTIEVQLWPSGQLGEPTAILEGVRVGTIEIAFLPVDTAEYIFPGITALSPLFEDLDEEQAIELYTSEQAAEILEELRLSEKVRCIGFSVGGIKSIWTKERVETIEDFEGLRLRIPETPMYSLAFQALGFSTSSMSLAQVYDGIQAGLLEGVELDPESMLRYNLYEQCKYCLETRHAVEVNTFFVSDAVFQGMTEEQQEIVSSAIENVSTWLTGQYWENKDAIYQELKEKSVTFYELDDGMKQEIENLVHTTLEGYLQE